MRQTVVHSCVAALVGAVLCSAGFDAESGVQLVVRADRPGARISPTLYGVFFEDITSAPTAGCTPNWSKTDLSSSPRP